MVATLFYYFLFSFHYSNQTSQMEIDNNEHKIKTRERERDIQLYCTKFGFRHSFPFIFLSDVCQKYFSKLICTVDNATMLPIRHIKCQTASITYKKYCQFNHKISSANFKWKIPLIQCLTTARPLLRIHNSDINCNSKWNTKTHKQVVAYMHSFMLMKCFHFANSRISLNIKHYIQYTYIYIHHLSVNGGCIDFIS